VPEMDFARLRERLEQETRQPDFATIRARRARRTGRWAAVGAVVTLVAVLAGGISAGVYLRHPAPPTVGPTGTPAPGPSASGPTPVTTTVIGSAGFAPSGTLFVFAQLCLSGCSGGSPTMVTRLYASRDLGASWSALGEAAGGPADGNILAAGDTQLWLAGSVAGQSSDDGGRTWRGWSLGGNNAGAPGYAGIAGGTLWLAQNGVVAVATGGGAPALTASQPPAADVLDGLAAFGADSAAVLTGEGAATWYTTVDRGAHWNALGDPCASTPYPRSSAATMSRAPDGSLWVVCAAQPGAGQQAKQLVTSADGGRTWQVRGALESAGYGTRVIPFSAVDAWRTGPRADVYRTTDGLRWTRVATTGDAAGGSESHFTAFDPDTAVYFQDDSVYATRDGGHTWQRHALPSG
jgi:hypothetical protein